MLLFGRRKWVQQVLRQLICILSNGRRNSTQQQEGCDTFTLSEALVSWASSSSLCLFLSPLSFLPSGASVHPSGSVWKTVGLELCDCYNFHLTPHPTPSRLLSKATCFCFCFFLWFSPPLTGKSAGFIDWIVMATWYLAIYCSLRRHSSASESRLLDICMFTWCMSGWHQRIDNLKTKVCTIEYSEP